MSRLQISWAMLIRAPNIVSSLANRPTTNTMTRVITAFLYARCSLRSFTRPTNEMTVPPKTAIDTKNTKGGIIHARIVHRILAIIIILPTYISLRDWATFS